MTIIINIKFNVSITEAQSIESRVRIADFEKMSLVYSPVWLAFLKRQKWFEKSQFYTRWAKLNIKRLKFTARLNKVSFAWYCNANFDKLNRQTIVLKSHAGKCVASSNRLPASFRVIEARRSVGATISSFSVGEMPAKLAVQFQQRERYVKRELVTL